MLQASLAKTIKPVLTKIKIRPGKPSSPEIQRIQLKNIIQTDFMLQNVNH